MISATLLYRVHKSCGLFVATLLLIQATTGILNTYRYELARFFDPAGMLRESQGAAAPLNDLFESLRDGHDGDQVTRLVFPKRNDDAYFVHFVSPRGDRYGTVDPGSSEILRSGSLWAFPFEAAARVHYDYTVGLAGIGVVALTGVLGLFMLATGILYWTSLPGRRRRPATKQRVPRRLTLRQLHRSTGISMALLAGFSLVTGTVLAVDYAVDGLGSPAEARRGYRPADGVDIGRVVDRAQALYPGHAIRDIRFFGDGEARVFFLAPDVSARAVHEVRIDMADRSVTRVADATSSEAIWVTWLPVHTGEFLRPPGRVAVLIGALAIVVLASSGPALWLIRARRRKPAAR